MNYQYSTLKDILADAKANGHEDALKLLAGKRYKYKDKKTGEEKSRKISFIELKREYFLRFYRDEIPVSQKPKKVSMYELINKL